MDIQTVNIKKKYLTKKHEKIIFLSCLLVALIFMFFVCLFVGSSNMSIKDCFLALANKSSNANNRIMWNIRLPRVLAAMIAGAGLSIAGLIMQTTLGNPMASPSVLGVSNAAVFGANLSIIVFAGGFLSTGNNIKNYLDGTNPFETSVIALIFSIISIFIILALCKLQSFSPNAVVLAGIGIGAIWTAGTTLLQFFATDVGLSAAVVWNFGDLGRATYTTDLIMGIVVLVGFIFFIVCSWKYNALLTGDNVAKSLGINTDIIRFLSLFIASLITAVCVSFLGIIGFVGIICPHIMKRILGNDHRFLIPASLLSGSLLLLFSDTLSRSIGNGTALPVGAITSLLGAPFFLYLIFARKENERC